MPIKSLALILTSVLLTAFSQILLKVGMSKPSLQEVLAGGNQPMASIVAIATSPFVLIGMGAFGLSALVWLVVLSRVQVSTAYPFVSLGIVITTLVAWLLLGEAISPVKGAGVGLIVLGVIAIAITG